MSDRKYRQQGYQDSGGGERRDRRGPQRPRDPSAGPRGRGLGKPTKTVFRCAVCGTRQSPMELTVESTCEKCNTDLHTCTHCSHFDTSQPNECRQSVKQPIMSKAKRNTCELFTAKAAQETTGESQQPSDGKAAFDALFNF